MLVVARFELLLQLEGLGSLLGCEHRGHLGSGLEAAQHELLDKWRLLGDEGVDGACVELRWIVRSLERLPIGLQLVAGWLVGGARCREDALDLGDLVAAEAKLVGETQDIAASHAEPHAAPRPGTSGPDHCRGQHGGDTQSCEDCTACFHRSPPVSVRRRQIAASPYKTRWVG